MTSLLSLTGTTSKVAGATSATSLLAQNMARVGAVIYSDSSATMYVKLGAAATTDDWTVKMSQDDYFEVPTGYCGVVTAIWSAASGQARVTELV